MIGSFDRLAGRFRYSRRGALALKEELAVVLLFGQNPHLNREIRLSVESHFLTCNKF